MSDHNDIMFFQSAHDKAENALIASLSAVCVTIGDVERAIVAETYTRLPSGKVMICELTMDNGHTEWGAAAVVNPASFNEPEGCRIARLAAEAKVREKLGFRLQEMLHRERDALPLS